MTKVPSFLLLIGCSWIGAQADVQGQLGQQLDPEQIIMQSINALGGENKLRRLERYYVKSKGRLRDTQVEWQVWQDLPSRNKQVVTFEDMKKKWELTVVLSGREGWKTIRELESQRSETTEYSEDDDDSFSHVGIVRRLYPLTNKREYSLAMGEHTMADGLNYCLIRATTKQKTELRLYFDKKTLLLAKCSATLPVAAEVGAKRIEHQFEKYKDFDGLKYATKHVVRLDGALFSESEDVEVLFPSEFPKDTFKRN